MRMLSKLRRMAGIDTAQSRYAYGKDERYGYVAGIPRCRHAGSKPPAATAPSAAAC